ncbi:metallophosphoesterase family protein [Sphingopyxis flava]|uniref:Calcineurin-like phosphoesterase n=1 Tax=Sphingopyxis flava TaxID=1507287 RepID=A0A1T5CVF1_9SPHN|nr:metallophosphoesterase [Sphingopyxis flava]SKB63475.1 Calcineurin-like phosphoesterase [Sphingopyxis flava]
MKFSLTNGKTVALIGDPHLGRKFENGVPLHRRGERERKQLTNFQEQLAQDVDIVVSMGDTFDHPAVSNRVVMDVYNAVEAAAVDRTVIIIAGNHDLPRNLTTIGAFEILEALLDGNPNVMIVRKPTLYRGLAIFPWEWDVSAFAQVEAFPSGEAEVALGHWDLQSFGGDDSHICPTAALKAKFGDDLAIYSGHYHLPGDYEVDGHIVHCTGSMEPYSHAEDPDGSLYVTLTLEELEARDDLHDKCVRVLLAEGEELPSDLDCLALTAKRAAKEDTEVGEITLGDFNWSSILAQKLEPLTPEVRGFIEERLSEVIE